MSKLIALAGLLLGAMLAGQGAVSLSEQWNNRAPKAVSFAQFAAQKPTSGNFRISGGTLNVAGGVWIENQVTNEIGSIYVPLRATGSVMADTAAEKPVFLLVRVDDPKIASTIAEMRKLNKAKPADAALKALQWQINNRSRLFVSRPVEGVLAEGFDALDDGDKQLIHDSGVKMAPNFVILQENVRPQYGATLFMIAAGAGLMVWGVLRLRGRAQNI